MPCSLPPADLGVDAVWVGIKANNRAGDQPIDSAGKRADQSGRGGKQFLRNENFRKTLFAAKVLHSSQDQPPFPEQGSRDNQSWIQGFSMS